MGPPQMAGACRGTRWGAAFAVGYLRTVAAVNLLVKPVLKLLSFPLLLLTLGLFLIVINALMLGLTALLTDRLTIDGVGPAVIASLIISAVTWAGDNLLGLKKD